MERELTARHLLLAVLATRHQAGNRFFHRPVADMFGANHKIGRIFASGALSTLQLVVARFAHQMSIDALIHWHVGRVADCT